MDHSLLIAVLFALGGGAAIGIQSNFTTISSRAIGPISTGTLAMIGGGILGVVVLVILLLLGNFSFQETSRQNIILPLTAGAMGLLIMSSVTFALPRVGLAAGFVIVLLGQLVVGVVVDVFGWSGGEPMPLSGQRILGLAVLGVAIFLLLPKE